MMPLKLVNLALNATFLVVNGLSKYRDHLLSRKFSEPQMARHAEEARLVAEWVEHAEEERQLE